MRAASAIVTASAMTSPPVKSRLAFIRSPSTSSPDTSSVARSSAPAHRLKISGIVSHSAGQFPRPRSCSCTAAESMVATRPGTRTEAARIAAQATGFRFCGIVDEAPRPAPAGSKASATSVCINSEMSFAILPSVAVTRPSTVAISPNRSRERMPRDIGMTQAQQTRQVSPRPSIHLPRAKPACPRLRQIEAPARSPERRANERDAEASHPANPPLSIRM